MAQHDYVIDNSTGANVRADINSVLQAIASNNSGSSAPSTTYAFQLFANTTTSKLQIRNAANNAFVDLLSLDGSILLADGSASSPSLSFSDDTNTGIFSSAADTFNIATGGTQRFVVDSSGNVGIGADPTEKLTISSGNINFIGGTNDAQFIKFGDSGDDDIGKIFYFHGNNNMVFTTNASEAMRIDDSQRLLLGTTTEGNAFADDLTVATSGTTGITIRSGSSSTGNIYFSDATSGGGEAAGFFEYNHSNNNLSIGTNESTRMIVDSSGRVGIGNDSPGSFSSAAHTLVLNTNSGNCGLTISTSAADQIGSIFFAEGTSSTGDGRIRYEHANNAMAFSTDNSERMRIDSSGNVGIGTTSPSAKFHVSRSTDNQTTSIITNNGTTGGNCLKLTSGGTGAGTHIFTIFSNNQSSETERLRVDANGHLILGTGTPANYGGRLKVFSTAANDAVFSCVNSHSGTVRQIDFFSGTNTSRIGSIQSNSSSTAYNTSSDYRLKENATAISDGITRLKTLKPYRFNFKIDPTTTVDGFFAHEVTAVPEAITGEKDAVNEDGSIEPQEIDQSKLVPLLVAAVQELIGKVEALEAA